MPQIILHDDFECCPDCWISYFWILRLPFQISGPPITQHIASPLAVQATGRCAQEAMYVLASIPSLGNSL